MTSPNLAESEMEKTKDYLKSLGLPDRDISYFTTRLTVEDLNSFHNVTTWEEVLAHATDLGVASNIPILVGRVIPVDVLRNPDRTWMDMAGLDFSHAFLAFQHWSTEEHPKDFSQGDFCGTSFAFSKLVRASFREIWGTGSKFVASDLSLADFHSANLLLANFSLASLAGANLKYTKLVETDFTGADLSGTVLDPKNTPNQKHLGSFERASSGRYLGYRTARSILTEVSYEVGQVYKAPIFSTCESTECHPGLYLYPTIEDVLRFVWGSRRLALKLSPLDVVRVSFNAEDLHCVISAGNGKPSWRVREFQVEDQFTKDFPSST